MKISLLLPKANPRVSRNFRLLGLLPLMFFLGQVVHYWRTNEPAQLAHLLWTCNLGNLLLAIGLLGNRASLIRVSVLWILPGLVIWFLYVVLTWGVFLSSTHAHVGGTVVALLGIWKVGMDRVSWLYAFGGYLLVQLISRLSTPAALNVNISQSVYDGWQTTFERYWKFWLATTLVTALILWGLGMLLRRLWPVRELEGVSSVQSGA